MLYLNSNNLLLYTCDFVSLFGLDEGNSRIPVKMLLYVNSLLICQHMINILLFTTFLLTTLSARTVTYCKYKKNPVDSVGRRLF